MNNFNLRKILKQNSFNIYLCVSNSDLVKRLENSNKRPLIKNKNIKNILEELLKKREKYYNKADLKIENFNSVNHTINELKKILDVNE
jgi:Shikimate kinase